MNSQRFVDISPEVLKTERALSPLVAWVITAPCYDWLRERLEENLNGLELWMWNFSIGREDNLAFPLRRFSRQWNGGEMVNLQPLFT